MIKAVILSKKTYGAIRLILGVLFLYSGCLKLMDLKAFAMVIDAFGLVPWQMRQLSALVISTAEVLVGAGLVLDIRGSLTALLSMLLLFTLVLAHGIHMGYDIDCGCFGKDDPVGEAFHGLRFALVRDMAMLMGVLYLYLWRKFTCFSPLSLSHYYGKIRSHSFYP